LQEVHWTTGGQMGTQWEKGARRAVEASPLRATLNTALRTDGIRERGGPLRHHR
jgi:hypothetical protein